MSTLLTYPTRTHIDLANLRPEDIHIVDIAHALSLCCRYAGHIPEHYSVAQHCVLTSYIARRDFALDALMHDASEYILGDIVNPVKHLPLLVGYRDLEVCVEACIALTFDLIQPMPPEVKEADHNAYLFEDFLLRQGKEYPEIIVPEEFLQAWNAKRAEARFLERYAELVRDK